MSLSLELKKLRDNRKSPKTEYIVDCLKNAALKGHDSATFSVSLYDDAVIKHLRAEGLRVEKVSDSRDGDYILVKF